MIKNNNMFREDIVIDAQNIYGGIKSHKDGELYTLKEMLKRIEALEAEQDDIKYFLSNPKKLNY
jgi:predicted neutral ceramidase superfamily lipid hydrolase